MACLHFKISAKKKMNDQGAGIDWAWLFKELRVMTTSQWKMNAAEYISDASQENGAQCSYINTYIQFTITFNNGGWGSPIGQYRRRQDGHQLAGECTRGGRAGPCAAGCATSGPPPAAYPTTWAWLGTYSTRLGLEWCFSIAINDKISLIHGLIWCVWGECMPAWVRVKHV